MDSPATFGVPAEAAHDQAPTIPAPSDRRVAQLAGLVGSGDYDILSLDVFDTLVFREAARPTDVFFQVAVFLRERGMLYESSSDESFVRERILAEGRARGRTPGHEATLEEIWAEFPRGYLRQGSVEDAREAEIRIERRGIRVFEPMRAIVELARRRGMKVALVSDTYFTRRQLQDLTGLEPDWTIVSCEHGRCKAAGLHRVLLGKCRVAPGRILHVGDDRAADVDGPESLGIARFWLRKFPEGFEELVGREIPDVLSRRTPFARLPDDGLTSLRSQAMATADPPHERWGAGVLGPVLAGYAEWLKLRCAGLGIDTVLCLMREGRALRGALAAVDAPLAAHEVYVSRYVALKAAIVTGSVAEIARFVLRPSPVRASKLLDQLGLAPADVPDLDPAKVLDHEESRALVERIAAGATLRRKVLAASAGARAGLLEHLRPMLPARGSRVAIADLGYKGTIQMGLQAVFDHERLGLTTHGLYLVTGGEVHETQATGAAVEGWLAENGQPIAMAHTFMRSPEFFEQSLMADCGTTLGHRPDGAPILDERRVPATQRREIADVQRGVEAFLRLWADYRRRHGPADADALRGRCRAIAVRAVSRPLPVELGMFAHWAHDENFGSGAVRTLTDGVDFGEWERSHVSAHQLASLPSSRVYWPFGFAWRQGEALGEAVSAIFLRNVHPGVFDAPDLERAVTVMWDDGEGFSERRSATSVCVPNARGACWHHVSLQANGGGPARIGFALGAPGDLLRVTGVRVHWVTRDGARDTETVPAADLAADGLGTLGPGLHQVTGAIGFVAATLAPRPGFSGLLEIDFFFAVPPLG